ncbi:hypothetical protein LguiB_013160 [Lonicera macranthoides]
MDVVFELNKVVVHPLWVVGFVHLLCGWLLMHMVWFVWFMRFLTQKEAEAALSVRFGWETLMRGLVFYKRMKDKHIVWELASTTIDQNTTLVTGGEYEVFLSFCGKDTRKAFTGFLYIYLVGAGIRTFRDNNELCVGEGICLELLKAIKESKISIPIFSESYAASKYCFLELTEMVECHRSEGQKIFPIFYNIKPSEVRHQTGSYEEAFSQHEKNFEGNVVQGWKDALRKVGELKGLELEETNG